MSPLLRTLLRVPPREAFQPFLAANMQMPVVKRRLRFDTIWVLWTYAAGIALFLAVASYMIAVEGFPWPFGVGFITFALLMFVPDLVSSAIIRSVWMHQGRACFFWKGTLIEIPEDTELLVKAGNWPSLHSLRWVLAKLPDGEEVVLQYYARSWQ